MPRAVDTTYITLRGRANYAKVLGKPVDDYEANQGRGNGKEWKIDLILGDPNTPGRSTAEELARLKKAGGGEKVKQKEDYLDGAPFIPLRHKAMKADGEPNDPPQVEDVKGQPWDQRKLIGNGSVVDIKVRIVDYGKGFKKGIYIAAIRVLDLVAYNRNEFEELDANDPYAMKAAGQADAEPESEPEVEGNADEPEAKPAPRRRRAAAVVEDELDDDVLF